MNLFDILFGKKNKKTSSGKKTRKARYNGRNHNKSYKKSRYQFKNSKSMRNKHRMKGG